MSTIDLIKLFKNLGCTDECKCAIASTVYLNLKEVHKMVDLEKLYIKDLDLLYFRGRERSEIIVPMSSCSELDLLEYEEIQLRLSGELKCVTMAICDPNSTICYYSISNNFIEK